MDILESLKQLRDDIKLWVSNNLNALNAKIDEKIIPIDSELDSTSTNPVQNQVVTKAINNIPRFSGDYNDLTNAPNIAEDESGGLTIADEEGNVILKVDEGGIHTTSVTINGENAATEDYVNEALSNIDIPDVDFGGYATEKYVDDSINAAKEELSESIVAESEDWKVVDGNGNIIFSVDAEGAHTTSLSLNGESVESIIDDKVAALVGSAPDKLNTLDELAAALGDDENFATTVVTELGKKVEKVEGKELSTNDFTDEYKSQLDNTPDWVKEPTKPTLADLEDDAEHRTVTDTEKAIWNNKSDFTGDYNDLRNAPNMYEDGSGNLVIADKDGNIIFRSDANGMETTQLIAKTLILDGVDIEDKVIFYEVEKTLELSDSPLVSNDDGNGNVVIETTGIDITDDNNGNVSITSDLITVTDDGNGNVTISI